MKLQDISEKDLESLEFVRNTYKRHGYLIAESDIPRIMATYNYPKMSFVQIEGIVRQLISLGFLHKLPPLGISDLRRYDLTEKGRSNLSLAEFREREKQEDNRTRELFTDQLKTNRTNRNYMRFSLGLAIVAIIISVIAIVLNVS